MLDQIVLRCLPACLPSSHGSNATSSKNEMANRISVVEPDADVEIKWKIEIQLSNNCEILQILPHHVFHSYRLSGVYVCLGAKAENYW